MLATPQRGLLRVHGRSPSPSRRSCGPKLHWNHLEFFPSLKIHVARLLMYHLGNWVHLSHPASVLHHSTRGRRKHVPDCRRKLRTFSLRMTCGGSWRVVAPLTCGIIAAPACSASCVGFLQGSSVRFWFSSHDLERRTSRFSWQSADGKTRVIQRGYHQ